MVAQAVRAVVAKITCNAAKESFDNFIRDVLDNFMKKEAE
jgi:hypothetical protein